MEGLDFAILAAALVAVLLFVVYLVKSRAERGQEPHYAREVYLYRGLPRAPSLATARRAAAALGAEVAARAQVAIYRSAGGHASGHGFVAEGDCVPPDCGVWLYGPKPWRGTPHVAPFNGAHWYQPAA
jgi:hypothetical protein